VNRGTFQQFAAGSLLMLFVVIQAAGGTHVVAISGDNAAPGSLAAPWRTIARGVSALYPGDTLLVREGTYDEVLATIRPGSPGVPIVIRAFPGELVEIRGVADSSIRVADILDAYTVVEGFTFRNLDYLQRPLDRGYWIELLGSHCVFRDNRIIADGDPMVNHDVLLAQSRAIVVGGRSVTVEGCFVRGQAFGIVVVGHAPRFVVLRNDTVYSTYQNNLDIGSAPDTAFHGTLVESCVLDTSWIEDNVQFEVNYSDPTSFLHNRGTILRNNAMGNAAENAIDLKGASFTVIEGNLIYGSAGDNDGPIDGNDMQGGAGIEANSNNPASNIIVRNNVVWDNCHGAVLTIGDHYYNNTFLNNRRTWRGSNRTDVDLFGVRVFTRTEQPRVFINNIVGAQGGSAVIDWRMEWGAQFLQANNLYYEPDGQPQFSHAAAGAVERITGLALWQTILATLPSYAYLDGKEGGSIEANPLFNRVPPYPVGAPSAFDFQVGTLSPARGSGRSIARATAAGDATTVLKVDDASGFTDGFGISAGDVIRIGGGPQVGIASIEYSSNTIVLDAPRTWSIDASVHPAYTGTAPDIGASIEARGDTTLSRPGSGSLRFTSTARLVRDNSTVTDSLVLRLDGEPLKALQFRLVTSGHTILRGVSRGSVLSSSSWWFFSNTVRSAVQEDGSVSDTCSVVILGTGTASIPPGIHDDLVTFRYDVVNATEEKAGLIQLVDVVGALTDGSDACVSPGGSQRLTIRNTVVGGDINDDDRIDVLDLVLLVDHILQRTTLQGIGFTRADISPWPGGDGVIDIRDLAVLESIILHQAYPDGGRINSGSGSEQPGTVAKRAITGGAPLVSLVLITRGTSVLMELRSSVEVAGLAWSVSGLRISHAPGSDKNVFGSFAWHCDSTALRGIHYAPADGVLEPGTYSLGQFTLPYQCTLEASALGLVVAGRGGELIRDAAIVASDAEAQLPITFALEQNYPNPFNPRTRIRLSVGERQLTTVKVFSILGQEVATLMQEVKDPGTYTVEFDATGLPSGAYFCRMEAGTFANTKKLVLVR
jgi:hypothetical protein